MLRFGLIFLLLLAATFGAAQADEHDAGDIKTAMLYNIMRFTTWSESAFENNHSPITICVGRGNRFTQSIDALGDKSIGGRPITVRYNVETENGFAGCHAAIIPADYLESGGVIPESENVLTVSDARGFAAAGGVIQFVRIGRQTRFQINPASAREKGIKLSSRIIRLAVAPGARY